MRALFPAKCLRAVPSGTKMLRISGVKRTRAHTQLGGGAGRSEKARVGRNTKGSAVLTHVPTEGSADSAACTLQAKRSRPQPEITEITRGPPVPGPSGTSVSTPGRGRCRCLQGGRSRGGKGPEPVPPSLLLACVSRPRERHH